MKSKMLKTATEQTENSLIKLSHRNSFT